LHGITFGKILSLSSGRNAPTNSGVTSPAFFLRMLALRFPFPVDFYFGFLYQGGSNYPETWTTGRIAGSRAASERPYTL
jgi:hypothetical protein